MSEQACNQDLAADERIRLSPSLSFLSSHVSILVSEWDPWLVIDKIKLCSLPHHALNRPCLINLLSFFFSWNITCLSPDCSAVTTPISSNLSVYLLLSNLRSELLDCGSTLAALIWFIPPKLFYSLPNWLREPSAPSKSTSMFPK